VNTRAQTAVLRYAAAIVAVATTTTLYRHWFHVNPTTVAL